MSVALYYGTTRANAEQILRLGFHDERRNFMTDSELIGVWLFDRPLDKDEGDDCEVYLVVEFDCSEGALHQFELFEDGKPYREWVVRADFIASHATVKLAVFPI